MIRLMACLISCVVTFADRRNWPLFRRIVRGSIREIGRWLICVAILGGVWLMLAVAQSIADDFR